jgi:putative membrane protein
MLYSKLFSNSPWSIFNRYGWSVFNRRQHQDRNNFDKAAHFAQGFVPAIIAREIIIRNQVLKNTSWLNFFVICICLAISAFYELIEWWVAIISKEAAESFLGTQGYVWDTQSDMALALLGAMVALVTLKQTHDRQLSELLAEYQQFD